MRENDVSSLIGNVIAGREVASKGRHAELVTSLNPYSGEIIWEAAAADTDIVESAIRAARWAFPPWATTPYEERRELVSRFVKLVQRDATSLARVIAQESGKPLWE